MNKIFFLLLTVAIPCMAHAQKLNYRDLLLMKSGNEIRCNILNKKGQDSLALRIQGANTLFAVALNDVDSILQERFVTKRVAVDRKPILLDAYSDNAERIDVLVLEGGKEIRGVIKDEPRFDTIFIEQLKTGKRLAFARRSVLTRKREICRRGPSEAQALLKKGFTPQGESKESMLLSDKPKKSGMSYLGLSYNFLIPKGDFARTDFGTQFTSNPNKPNELGFAKSGFSVGLDGAFMLDSKIHIGIATSIRLQFNDFNTEAFALSYTYYNAFTGSFNKANSNVCTYKSSLYMTGLAFSLPLGAQQKVAFDTRLLGGVALLSLTNPLQVTYDRSQPASIEYNTESASTCFGLETGFRFFFRPYLALGIKAGYTSADFRDISVSGARTGTVLNVTKSDANINNVNIGLSLSYCY